MSEFLGPFLRLNDDCLNPEAIPILLKPLALLALPQSFLSKDFADFCC